MERVRAVIVGSGFSGLCAAIKLHESGVTDLVVLEKAETLGGTWRDNRYPGCACDVESYLYSYSFDLGAGWSRVFAESAEIQAYLERVATERGVRKYLRFGAEFTRAAHDGERWQVHAKDGRAWSAEILVMATGPLSWPQNAKVKGVERFAGPSFHSASWRHDVPLEGKRVAVIGTGASAIQFIPHVAARAGHLDVYQRTPPWILPKSDRVFSARQHAMFTRSPALARAYRAWIYLSREALAVGFTGALPILGLAQSLAKRHLEKQVTDPALRKKLVPEYSIGCKRVLISNDYYPAIARENVSLITDPIEEVTAGGVVTRDGVAHPADVLIHGTGFRTQEYLSGFEILGPNKTRLAEAWRMGAEAYKGTFVAGFPNLFLLMGPNTALGHSSVVFMAEAQVSYMMKALEHLRDEKKSRLEVSADVQARYNEELVARLKKAVWDGECTSWYKNAQGKNTTLWPGYTFEFWNRLRKFEPAEFIFS